MWSLLWLWINGCDLSTEAPETTLNCDTETNGVQFGTTSGPSLLEVEGDLFVTGTALHRDGLTIRQLTVAGIAATNESFNFETWSATIPYATLLALASIRADGFAALEAVAIDACRIQHRQELFTIEVDTEPAIEVLSLSVSLALPSSATYLPADGVTAAVVNVTANPKAAGAAVQLGASLGDFSGASSVDLVFSGDGVADARAQALFSSGVEGSALITATASDQLAAEAVEIVGAPLLVPSTINIDPGDAADISVFTEGTIVSCSAGFADGVTVTSGNQDLSQGDAVTDTDFDGRIDIRVEADLAAPIGETVDIVCEDIYRQRGFAFVTVQ